MIERLLAAERALADGQLETAERLFGQVAEADPRNAIAVVGLAEVAVARSDEPAAAALARRALAIDPDDAAARRIAGSAATLPAAAMPTTSAPPAATVSPAAMIGARSQLGRLAAWLRSLLGRQG